MQFGFLHLLNAANTASFVIVMCIYQSDFCIDEEGTFLTNNLVQIE
jgi:hypothetical protein